jgi:F-type H+-transporting ATPase subunit delta
VEHPAVSYADKEKVLRRVATGVAEEPLRLALLMIRRGRPGAIDAMVERFGELLRRERGVSLAEVRTAQALDDEQRGAIAERLRALTGDEIEMREVVDDSLIGGVSVRIGDRLYDASVRSRLERLRARLTAV